MIDDGKVIKSQDCKSSSSSDHNPTFLLLQFFLILSIKRQASFSMILLSEAIHFLPLSGAVLLLRMLIYILDDYCEIKNYHDNEINNNHHLNDDNDHNHNYKYMNSNNKSNNLSLSLLNSNNHISRIITWIEAIIDGHFSSIALHIIDNKAQTRQILIKLIQIINNNEINCIDIQKLLGLWIQMNRVIHHHSQQTKPMNTLYQVEKLSLY